MGLVFTSLFVIFVTFPKAPLADIQTQVDITLPKGASLQTMLSILKQQNILNAQQAVLLKAWIKWQGVERKIQAGEYRFSKTITPEQLLKKWLTGDVILYAVTIPEGITVDKMLEIISAHPKLQYASSENNMVLNEGIYFPDTYYFSADTTVQSLLSTAKTLMMQKLNFAWETRSSDCIVKTPYEALILASIIEKEAGNESEKTIISGVFQRRMKKNMRLQADPTVIYGLQENYQGRLTKNDLKLNTPYNTYIHRGLPPTPIALPSFTSIVAVLNPDKSDYLYFVAKGDGTHHFSSTLQEHNRAVTTYILKDKATCKPENSLH